MPIVLFFSSRQISAHPIRNFRSNQSTSGRLDNIDYNDINLSVLTQLQIMLIIQQVSSSKAMKTSQDVTISIRLACIIFSFSLPLGDGVGCGVTISDCRTPYPFFLTFFLYLSAKWKALVPLFMSSHNQSEVVCVHDK